MGHFRVGLQRSRSAFELSVRTVWRSRSGLKRGLIEDLVVAPYATMLAAEINPRAAMDNLRRLEKEGALGRLWLLRVDRLHGRAAAGGSEAQS